MVSPLVLPLIGLGAPELLIILAAIILLFGASKLPDLARGSGRALRIFKAETKGLMDDDDDAKSPEQRQIDANNRAAADPTPQATQQPAPQAPPQAAPQPPPSANPGDTRPPGTV